MTFQVIQHLVWDNCQELQGIADFNQKKVKVYINRGYYDFVRRTKCIADIVDITTVADQHSYTATDAANLAFVYKPYQVRYIEAGNTDRGDILKYKDFSEIPDVKSAGTPFWYWTRGVMTRGEFEIGTHPVIGETAATLRVYAYMFPLADLSLDADEPLIKEAWQDALVDYATWKLFKVYQHNNREWKEKAREHKFNYMEMVDLANQEMITDSDDVLEVIDVY